MEGRSRRERGWAGFRGRIHGFVRGSGIAVVLAAASGCALACASPTRPYRSQAVISAHYASADRSAAAARRCLREQLLTHLVLGRGQRVLQRQNALAAGVGSGDPAAVDELPQRLRLRMLFEDGHVGGPAAARNAVVLVSFDHSSPVIAARVTNAVARAWLNVSKWEGLLGVESCLAPIRIDHRAVSIGLAGL
jgi:hypothetical protein